MSGGIYAWLLISTVRGRMMWVDIAVSSALVHLQWSSLLLGSDIEELDGLSYLGA
jgi:steroid 5-alpha reductase family enzyme